MAFDYGDAGMDFGDSMFGDTNFVDFGGEYNLGDYLGGGSGYAPNSTIDNLADGYDVISNPNSLQVPSDDKDPYNESPLSQFGKQIKGPFAKGLAGLFGPVGRVGYGALTQDRSMVPSLFGSMVGNAILPGFGGMIGGWAGSKVDMPTYSGPMSENPGFNGADVGQTLMQLYGMSQAGKGLEGASDMNSALQQQMRSLADIYGPNSPYAAQMRQTLARKDAAAGRNSQYGPREAQLQALLAEKQTQATNALSQAAQVGNTNALAMNKYKNQMLGNKIALAGNIAKKFGLFDMFGKGGRTPPIVGSGIPALSDIDSSFVAGNFGSGGASSNPLLNWLD